MPEHLAGIAGQLHGLGHTRDVASGPGVLLALGLREGDLAGVVVPQLDPGLQDLLGSGGGLVEKKPSHHHTITPSQEVF